MRVLLITPPLLQPNSPYPAMPQLAGYLRQAGGADADVVQADASLALLLRLFSPAGLRRLAALVAAVPRRARTPSLRHFLDHAAAYTASVAPVLRFLQGREPLLAARIATRRWLPEGPRFAPLAEGAPAQDLLHELFGALGVQDRAKHLASLYLDDLADVIREGVDPAFGFARYAERLAVSAPSFAPLRARLEGPATWIDRLIEQLTDGWLRQYAPALVGLTVPFPGNLYGALRIARQIKRRRPACAVVLGGGYVNTELRELAEPALFDYVDYVTLDDGEQPLRRILQALRTPRRRPRLLRTFRRVAGVVRYETPAAPPAPLRHGARGTPAYDGLALEDYFSLLEMPNPMHRLWSDGRWNKLTLAHGCYWRRCAFCDTTLDYIGRFDPASADELVRRIERVAAATGQRGFHFTDEAAPPALLRALAERLLARGLGITWWANIRFEPAFTPELARLLARSGCIAVTGGLEAAHDRLLRLMDKGITLRSAARALRALAGAGILVHAYLMYGFPTQTVAETRAALEAVRRLFAAGWLQSAYWHRFALSAHSPIARRPAAYGIRLRPRPAGAFAHNELAFEDLTGVDHEALGPGLRRAVYNYMHGVGLDVDVRHWLPVRTPAPRTPKK